MSSTCTTKSIGEDSGSSAVWYKCHICDILLPSAKSQKQHCKMIHGKFSTTWSSNRIFMLPTKQDKKRISKTSQINRSKGPDTNAAIKNEPEDNDLIRCPSCPRTFKHLGYLDLHIRKRYCTQPSRKFSCNLCPSAFDCKSKLEMHTLVHTMERPFPCYMCSKSYKLKVSLEFHTNLKHTMERALACKYCKKRFVESYQLKVHIRGHTGKGMMRCGTCAKCFLNRQALQTHERTHSDVKQFPCTHCEAGFRQSHHLKAHTNSRHSDKPKPYKCPICPAKFETMKKIDTHFKGTHPGKNCYFCAKLDCPAKFSSNNGAKFHFVRDHGGQRFKCEFCSYTNHRKHRVEEHKERMHVNPKVYTCTDVDDCGLKFAKKIEFLSHRKIHK